MDGVGYRIRLRVRLAMALNSLDVSRVITFEGYEVTVESEDPNQPLSDSTWIIFRARRFSSEEIAKDFGNKLRNAIIVAGLASHLGVDAGQDIPTTHVNEEWAKSVGLIEPHQRIRPNVHGLLVLPDDQDTRIPTLKIQGTVRGSPENFLLSIEDLGADASRCPLGTAEALVILNFALMSSQPISKLALSLSAVEALGQEAQWSDNQRKLIEELAVRAEFEESYPLVERSEVADALRRSLHRIGLRQGVMRIIDSLGLQKLKKEWDRIYGARSGLFHGTSRLSEPELAELAEDALKLCSSIVFTLAERQGLKLPKVARVNFDLE